MVTIGKLGKGQESYYLDSVASGAEDYYAGEGEAPGQWTGKAAAELGLTGDVQSHELKAILGGLHPEAGEPLPRILRSDRLPGFDVTFSAPKSVSALWAVADHPTAEKIRVAHERAVDAALGYLEREAAFTRLGTDGHTAAKGQGLIAAAFRHRMSRAGDPQLHTHVLVANLVKSPDGQWRSLDGQRLYRCAKSAGYLYQAQLRRGCSWSRTWSSISWKQRVSGRRACQRISESGGGRCSRCSASRGRASARRSPPIAATSISRVGGGASRRPRPTPAAATSS